MENENKRTSMSRHVLIRNLTSEWAQKEAELRAEMDSIISEQKRVSIGRKHALWKSWIYHVVAPLETSLKNHMNKKCMNEIMQARRNLYQKYIEYTNNHNHVVALDFYRPDLYDPFELRVHPCLRVVTSPLHEPFLMKWKDREEEKEFVISKWPKVSELRGELDERKISRASRLSVMLASFEAQKMMREFMLSQ